MESMERSRSDSNECNFSDTIILLFYCVIFNPLPNDKILDMTKLKAFADNKLNIAKMSISLFDRVENIVGKTEKCWFQHFLLFPHGSKSPLP